MGKQRIALKWKHGALALPAAMIAIWWAALLHTAIAQGAPVGADDGQFTIIFLPDPQNYWKMCQVGNPSTPYLQRRAAAAAQVDWIVRHKDALNLKLVVVGGDMVDWTWTECQWQNVDAYIKALQDAKIPLLFAPGNHDLPNPAVAYGPDNGPSKITDENRSYDRWQTYFPRAEFQALYNNLPGYAWGAITDNNANMYVTFAVGPNKFGVVAMEFAPPESVFQQVKAFIASHFSQDTRLIFVTHAYLRGGSASRTSCCGGGIFLPKQSDGYPTQRIWDDLIFQVPNIFLVMCGHSKGATKRVDQNRAGREVLQTMINFQNDEPGGWNGGDGFLQILTFKPNEDIIESRVYSPYLDARNGYLMPGDDNDEPDGYMDNSDHDVTHDAASFTFAYDMEPVSNVAGDTQAPAAPTGLRVLQ